MLRSKVENKTNACTIYKVQDGFLAVQVHTKRIDNPYQLTLLSISSNFILYIMYTSGVF